MSQLPGLNFQLGDDIDALRDAVREFAQAEIAPRAAEIDKTDQAEAAVKSENEKLNKAKTAFEKTHQSVILQIDKDIENIHKYL